MDDITHSHGMSQLLVAAGPLPWQPIKPGFSAKLLHADVEADLRVQLLRLEPGTVVARHRHEGEVHALNVAGRRLLLDTGQVVGPGDYAYEPPGNVDSWQAVGDEPLIVFVTVRGAISYLDEAGRPTDTRTTREVAESYRRFTEGPPVR
jgi:2,4'-dihydroxyacetophenone dioxygenase